MNESFKAKRLLDLIDGVDNVPPKFNYNGLYRLQLPNDTRTHGFLTPDTVSKLPWTDAFSINHKDRVIQLTVADSEASHINAAFQAVIDGAISLGTSAFPNLTSHSEMVRIIGAGTDDAGGQPGVMIRLERFAAPLFGICSRGAHLTAYVRDAGRPAGPGGLRIWVARRGADLHTYPGMLDTTVAGGVKAEDTPLGCILAESDEEASLPCEYVQRRVVATGVVTYVTRSRRTGQVLPTILYVYDLELEGGVQPRPKDGEVEGFYLMTVEEITKAMMGGEFKPNCCLVMLDFFVRQGLVTEENERDYLEIVTRLKRRLPVPVTPRGS